MAQNMVQMAFLLNKYSYCRIHRLPPFFVPKQTFTRIDYLRLGARLVEKIAAIMLKLLLKNGQKKVG